MECSLLEPRGVGGRSSASGGRRREAREREPTSKRMQSPFHGLATGPARVQSRVELGAMAIEVPEVLGHPNRLPFDGVLTLVDVPSDKAPSGSRGHRVVLTREAAETALPTLLGMAVGYKAGWDGHDARQKCGIITAAELDGQELRVSGYLFARDFPEMGTELGHDGAMGMSYELADAHVADMRASVWTVTRATFTGAAILLREKAAYKSTSFQVRRAEPGTAAGTMRMRRPSTARHSRTTHMAS